MSFDLELAKRIRAALQSFPLEVQENFNEKKMFGGIAYLYKGKMTVGIIKKDLMVRVLGSKMKDVLQMNHVRPMDFTKRPMKEFIYVSQAGIETEEQLQHWVELGLEHAKSKLK
ncbi:TfoX/Sxy family protein [Kriegella aquimaris]|uniref:TfoX N-terminal domain-containing protein n=1 Tax=Kriegella aquimaris TaxID=192904 RepID=A0A1G9JTL0_9FLAO|nr:TfoX/Sxy family protein [Kriegella aquimaris]SDL40869.1 TfoX N-terminal domain-containing protein [Kriegella aquimaris]